MGLVSNIKNKILTRSFVKRTIREALEEMVDKSIVPLGNKFVNDLNDKLVKEVDYIVSEHVSKSIKEHRAFSIDVNNVMLFLQKYYGKKYVKDFNSHYISYFYSAPSGFANLGDYIQSIATEMAITKCATNSIPFEYVLRSSLTEHSGGTCVMQGWYEHKQLTFLPGPDTRPVWVGTHFCSDARNLIKTLFSVSSIRFKDIGCRDKSTMAFCQSLGMTAYFSRCLTLTLPKRSVAETQNANMVYIVDCSNEILKHLPANIVNEAKILSQRNFPFYDWMDWRQCRASAEDLLEEYKKNAKLVITTALHCAQPCLAMGIPVIFINPELNEENRFSSMEGIIEIYSLKDLKEGKIRFDVGAPDIEDLKTALLRNLCLSMKESLSDEEAKEIQEVRDFINQYDILQ